MNERIRELLVEAHLFCYNDGTVSLYGEKHVGQAEIQKFAELLIRECANTLTIRASYYTSCSSDDPTTAEWFSGTVNGLKEGADLIKNHFGVEE